jgi:DNA repair protein SbcC/Rad50
MILDRLKLSNFRSYTDAQVDFAPGVTLFEGDIGSGKSSLLFAVEFALFGLADVPGDHLLRAGEKEGLVELTFRSGGRTFTVGRRLVRSKAGATSQKDAYLIEEGARQDLSVEQLRAAVIKVLGFREGAATRSKSQVFRYGVFTPQEEMKAILEQGAEERKQTLRRAFGIEEYKRARENGDLVKQALRERAAGIEALLQGVPKLEQERSEAQASRASLALQVKEAEGGREHAMAARKAAEAAARGADVLESRLRDLERAVGAIDVVRAKQEERRLGAQRALSELAVLEPEVEPLKEASSGLPQLEQEVAAAESREEERRKLDQELARAETRQRSLEARKDEIAGESELIRKVTDASDSIQEGKRALDAARKGLQRVREEAAAAGEAADRLGALKKRQATLEKEAAGSAQIEVKFKEREEAAKAGAQAAKELAQTEENLKAAQEAQGSARQVLERVEADLDELSGLKGKANCPKCHQPLDAAHLAVHRLELEAGAREARTKLAQAQGQARAMERSRAGLSKTREDGERAARDRAALSEALKRALEAGKEAEGAGKEVEVAAKAAERAEELARHRKGLERDVEAKLPFEKKAAELELAARRWREVSDHFRKVMREMEETSKAAREARAKRDALSADPAQVKKLREQVSTARVKAAKLRELERRLAGKADLVRHLKEAESELADLSRRKAVSDGERQTLAAKLEKAPVKSLRAAFEAAAQRVAALEERLKGARDGLALQEQVLARANERLLEAAASRGELDRVRHTRDFIEQCFQVALEDIELKVLSDLNSQLNARFQEYFGRLMEGAPVDVQVDEEFTPQVLQGANPLPVAALSGGERTSIALAYRLALNILVSRAAGMDTPDLLILDEPTDGFSKEQLARVGELLHDLDCQQVVLVSHERELETCADQVFEVVKDGTESRVEAR